MTLTDKLYGLGKAAVMTAAALTLLPNYSDAQLRRRQIVYSPQTIERTVESQLTIEQKAQKIRDHSYEEIKNVIGDYLIKEKEENLKQNVTSSTPLERDIIFKVFSKPQEVCKKFSEDEQKKYIEFNPNNLSQEKKEFYTKALSLKLNFKKQGTPYEGEKYDPIKLTLFLMEEHINR